MKKWKQVLCLIPVYTLILALVIAGIWPSVEGYVLPFFSEKPQGDGDQLQVPETIEAVTPKNVIQIGDTFECYPEKADGHLLCTVTDVRSVTQVTECPPKEAFGGKDAVIWIIGADGTATKFPYEEWFTEGGAYDHGARIMLVDLEVTNVDSVAWLSDGTKFNTTGLFLDDDAFHAAHFVDTADMSIAYQQADGSQVVSYGSMLIYYSQEGTYAPEKDGYMLGDKRLAIQIPIGQTVRYTLGYYIDPNTDGTARDLSKLWLSVMPGRNILTEGLLNLESSIFIDTKLGSGEE